MSGLEVLGIVASVIQIADVGGRLSVKLCAFSHKVKHADANIRAISNDVSLTCNVLRELGDTLKKDEQKGLCSNNSVATAERVMKECMKVFVELEAALDGKGVDVDGGKGMFKRIGRGLKFSVVEPQIELLRSNLERLKSTLLLMLNVIIYAEQLRSKTKMPELQEQQELIKILNEEKKQNDWKFEQLTKSIEGLELSKVNADDSVSLSLPANTSRQQSENSSLTDVGRAESAGYPILVHMAQQVQEIKDEADGLADQVKSILPPPPAQVNKPDGSGSDELSHYCALVRSLLREIEEVQYKIDHGTRGKVREGILHSHERTSDFLTGKYGHNRVYQVFCETLGDMAIGRTLKSVPGAPELYPPAGVLATTTGGFNNSPVTSNPFAPVPFAFGAASATFGGSVGISNTHSDSNPQSFLNHFSAKEGELPAAGVPQPSTEATEHFRLRLNTYIYEYLLKSGYYDCASAMVHSDDFPLKTQGPSRTSPSHRRDRDINGMDDNTMDTDSKDDISVKWPEDLPRPDVPLDPAGSVFLFDWFCLFWDIFHTQRSRDRSGVAGQYLQHTQGMQRMRAEAQKAVLQQPGLSLGQMNQFGMRGGVPNGMMQNELQKRAMQNNTRNLTPQQLAQLQNQKQMLQHQVQRENSDMDLNGHRPQSPASTDNAPSPLKRPRLEGGQFNGQPAPPNGRGQPQGMQGPNANGLSAALLMANGINPTSLTASQFQSFQSQNPAVQAKSIHHQRSAMTNQAMPKGMMNPNVMPNQGSPMMQPLPDVQNMAIGLISEYYAGNPTGSMPMRAMQPPGGQKDNHALQDYQIQLMLLEQQNKKRLIMARHEQDSMTRANGQPVMPGQIPTQQPLAPGMSPQESKAGPSPNPSDQIKRETPKIGTTRLPGSPTPGDGMAARGSPAAMNFGGMPQDMGGAQFIEGFQMNKMKGMNPNSVPNMRPPNSNPGFNGQMNAPMEAMQRTQQAGNRMPSGNWEQQGPQGEQIMQQPPQGQQPQQMRTPQERNAMPPPPQAPPAGEANAGRTQPSSPQQNPAVIPTQSNKSNPKKKGEDKDRSRKRPMKKNSTANANTLTPLSEAESPPIPTPSTPITPQNPSSFNSQKGPNTAASAVPPISAPMPQGPPPPQQPDPVQVNSFPDISMGTDQNYNLDFNALDTGDVLENFDFDSFLNTDDQIGFSFDPTLTYPTDGDGKGDGDADELDLVDDLLLQWTTLDKAMLEELNRRAGIGVV